MNDPLKNFKIDYKESKPGELEDEIIQQVTAGYTGFDMPGTQLSGYSESHEGLFGVKVASKFGPLMLTTIASNEQGESQKLSVSNSGGASAQGSSARREQEYVRNRYFFLDTAYITHYNMKYATAGGNPSYQFPPELVVNQDSLEVWLKINTQDTKKYLDIGCDTATILFDSAARKKAYGDKGLFVRLLLQRHYHLEKSEGWIRFADSVNLRDEGDLVAIKLRTMGDVISKGGGSDTSRYLWVLKPEESIDNMVKDPERFRLMWRNVYEIPSDVQDKTKFKLQVYYTKKNTPDTVKVINGVYVSQLLGLTKEAQPLIDRSDIYDFEKRELRIPPFSTGPDGNEPFANPALTAPVIGDMRDTLIYRYGPKSNVMDLVNGTFTPTFSIETSGSSKKTEFDLGLGVMEKTVSVKADGVQLQPNIDYVVNAEIGKLDLISPRARAAEKIDIEYQRESLFMPERKLFLGMRAELKLPFISENSLAGLSLLYQSTSISQQLPRIGQEPFRKLLVDFNTKLDFAPEWMTKAVNAMPLVKTDAPSNVTFEFEAARSMMNPNTEKQAYIDDFESCKQVYSLGDGYRNWYQASPPYAKDSLSSRPPAWDFYWFTPVYSDERNRVSRDSVWVPEPGRYNTGIDKYESVLRLHCTPAPNSPGIIGRYRRAWAGIMTPVPVGMNDRKRDQYFELLVRNQTGGTGTLRIQMGQLSEDVCVSGAPPNGRPDREDTSLIWRENHDPTLDKGIDGLPDKDETYSIPDGLGGWLPLPHGNTLLGEWKNDPARDNYALYDENNPGNYRFASRLQGDGWAMATEDINNDGTYDTRSTELYHEFIIDLTDTASPYIDRTANLQPGSGWRRYRIPIHVADSSTRRWRADSGLSPDDWNKIKSVRLIWSGFDTSAANAGKENQLLLSGMQFVGNQWEAVRDTAVKGTLNVSAIGSREDSVYYREVQRTSLISRQLDETNHLQPEQALRMTFDNLRAGETVLAQRSFSYQPLNVSSYDSLTLVMYGMPPAGANESVPLYDGNVQFVFRFGSDTGTYYEYRRKIRARWDNFVCVNLKDLSNLKLEVLTRNPAGAINDSSADGTLRIRARAGQQPNFANITWIGIGVVNAATGAAVYSGELWINEFKVAGIKKFNGWSSRASLTTQWADLLGISAGMDYGSGDFRTMTDSKTTMGDSRVSGNLSINTGLDKFMPSGWGVSIPVGGSVTSSLSRPQLKPNTDVYLYNSRDNKPDGFVELVRDVFGASADTATKSEHYETRTFGQSFFISYSKSSTSSNPAVNLLLERMTTKFNYNLTANQARRGARPNGTGDYENLDSTRTYTGGLAYDLSPRDPPAWTRWKPFGSKAAAFIPGNFRDLEFTLLPSRVTLDLAQATYTSGYERRDEPGITMNKISRDLNVSHGLTLDLSPAKPVVDLSFSLAVQRDFPDSIVLGTPGKALGVLNRHILNTNANPLWDDYYILENERSRSQKFRIALTPELFSGLTHSADYTADYSGALTTRGSVNSTEYINAKVASEFSFNSALMISSLLGGAPTDSGFLGKMAAGMKKGCDQIGFTSVNFTYSAKSDLTNGYLGSAFLERQKMGLADFTAYQFGFKGRGIYDIITGDMNDRTAFGGMRYRRQYNDEYDLYRSDSRMVSRRFQVSTSLGITRPIDLRFTQMSLGWSRQYTVQQDTAFFDTTTSFPEVGLGASSSVLDRVKILARYFQGMNLSSSFSYKKNRDHKFSSGGTAATGRSYDMSPLVAVEGSVKKWPVRFSYQHTLGNEKSASSVSSTKTSRNGDNLDMSYDIPPPANGLGVIKFLYWSLPVRGKTSTGMRFSRDHSITFTGPEKTSDDSNLSLTPHVSYVFTDNVTGTLEYTGSRTAKNGASTTTNTMALIAEVRF
jgi:hypothetical protein